MAAKTFDQFTASIINTLESLDITYAIGGAFASIAYGEARTTGDIDISIVLPAADVKRFVDAIQQLGYYIDLNAIVDAMVYRMPFNILDTGSGYKADLFLVEPTPLEASVLERRRRVTYDPSTNASAMLYSPEDVIIYKIT